MNTHCCESEEIVQALFKAFSHPARLAILEELRKGECCVCHLEALLGSRQAYISQQLAVLRDAGLISDRREGWNVYYTVNDPLVFDMLNTAYVLTKTKPEIRAAVKGCCCKYCQSKDEVVVE
jgi:DNA-binding transcriptional ArsR family regulator